MRAATRARASGLALAVLLGVALPAVAGGPDSAYLAQEEAWRAEREAGLRRPAGWLSLVGLWPLRPGRYVVGSVTDADLVFPAAAPARLGVLQVDSARVELRVAPGVPVTVAGDSTPVDRLVLRPDRDADGPTRLALGSLTFWVIERPAGRYLRVSDAASPTLRDFAGLSWYPVDPVWRRPARWLPPEAGRTLHVPDVLGSTAIEPSGGWLEFAVDGTAHRLEVPADADGWFVIFGDATNGAAGDGATYGAGRFLWVDRPAAGDALFIDFNRAYSPPCAFTDYATCPLPPPGNVLPIGVPAGEKASRLH